MVLGSLSLWEPYWGHQRLLPLSKEQFSSDAATEPNAFMATMFFVCLFPLNILEQARFLKLKRRQENTVKSNDPGGATRPDGKGHTRFSWNWLQKQVCWLLCYILDRTQPPPFHSFDNFPEHIQSESLVLRTILYLGLILWGQSSSFPMSGW